MNPCASFMEDHCPTPNSTTAWYSRSSSSWDHFFLPPRGGDFCLRGSSEGRGLCERGRSVPIRSIRFLSRSSNSSKSESPDVIIKSYRPLPPREVPGSSWRFCLPLFGPYRSFLLGLPTFDRIGLNGAPSVPLLCDPVFGDPCLWRFAGRVGVLSGDSRSSFTSVVRFRVAPLWWVMMALSSEDPDSVDCRYDVTARCRPERVFAGLGVLAFRGLWEPVSSLLLGLRRVKRPWPELLWRALDGDAGVTAEWKLSSSVSDESWLGSSVVVELLFLLDFTCLLKIQSEYFVRAQLMQSADTVDYSSL